MVTPFVLQMRCSLGLWEAVSKSSEPPYQQQAAAEGIDGVGRQQESQTLFFTRRGRKLTATKKVKTFYADRGKPRLDQ